MLRLCGGAEERTKSYSISRKNGQERKVKLAGLKYHKVDDDGTISCLHQECPSDERGQEVPCAATLTDMTVADIL